MHMEFLNNNLKYLDQSQSDLILNSEIPGELFLSKSGVQNIKIDSILFHSLHDPIKEAERSISTLKISDQKILRIFFGAGLGYTIQKSLQNSNATIVWMECSAGILKAALSLYDYSHFLKNQNLRILLHPFIEEYLYIAFKGLGTHSTSFIPHRPSFQWKEELYSECKMVCEKFFKKKDVNIATLSRFESIWTKNMIQNIPSLISMTPVSRLFGIAKELPIVVCGAGPGLIYDIDSLKKYREKYILIAVDTSVHILNVHNIDPDLIYSVDPQTINKSYLEGYHGNGILVFDPTSCYHTLRLDNKFQKGFFTSSPFPLLKLFTDHWDIEIGEIPFGGSVSTNSVSLAELMGASDVLLVGQDLAFTDGFAHCKGAILEERLNFKEKRTFRRELHNYRQLFALPKLLTLDKNGTHQHTNEKMEIFKKWFSDRAKDRNWINVSKYGSNIENLINSNLDTYFSVKKIDINLIKASKQNISNQLIYKENFNQEKFIENLIKTIKELEYFEIKVREGKQISQNIYELIKNHQMKSDKFENLLKKIDSIDRDVSAKKNVNSIVSLSLQRIIYMITEGYDSELNIEEKKNTSLGIAKKSLLLYTGLCDSSKSLKKQLKKVLLKL
jgi:hypothetical protein